MHRSRRLVWTVEWILKDGTRYLKNTPDIETVKHAYAIALRSQMLEKQQKDREGKEIDDTDMSDKDDNEDEDHDQLLPASSQPDAAGTDTFPDSFVMKREIMDPGEFGNEGFIANYLPPTTEESSAETGKAEEMIKTGIPENASITDIKPPKPEDPDNVDRLSRPPPIPEYYFYLVKPKTSGSRRVLIPIDPEKPLAEALRRQAVVEFPTIQVLSHSPRDLPENFLLELAYLKQLETQNQEMKALISSEKETFGIKSTETPDPPEMEPRQISNSDDILAILHRDVMGA
jgi:hypothetical protein